MRTLTPEEFRKLMEFLPEGTERHVIVNKWCPPSFCLFPNVFNGNGWAIYCTPDTWERAKLTLGLIAEAPHRIRREMLERVRA